MKEKDNFLFHFSFCRTLIFFMIIFVTFIVVSSISLNIKYTAIAQQQPSSFNEDISFDIDNVTFHIIWHLSMEFKCIM